MSDLINHPPHYKADNGIEAIDVVEGFGLNFRIGNAVTYLLRADRKGEPLKDLRKARWYVDREIGKRGGRADVPDDPLAPAWCGQLHYLASPFKNYPAGIERAVVDVAKVAGALMRAGLHFICPITHGYPIALHGEVAQGDHDVWLPFDDALMARCDGALIVQMDGWRVSRGVTHEIDFFRRAGRPVRYLDPVSLAISDTPHQGVGE